MRRFRAVWSLALAGALALPQTAVAANHPRGPDHGDRPHRRYHGRVHLRELRRPRQGDHDPGRGPLLEPSNGPTYFPFDTGILYAFHVDNDSDGEAEDVSFEVRFQSEIRLADPRLFTVAVGGIPGIPPITALDGPGSEGLGLRQTYTVTMVKGKRRVDLTQGQRLFAVPSNAGPRTMPNYSAPGGLFEQGVYSLPQGVGRRP